MSNKLLSIFHPIMSSRSCNSCLSVRLCEATLEFLLTHAEIDDIGPKKGTIVVNATYCNINP